MINKIIYIYDILLLFPTLKKEEWNALLRNVVHDNLPPAQALILQNPRNGNARQAIKGLTALWNNQSNFNSSFLKSIKLIPHTKV